MRSYRIAGWNDKREPKVSYEEMVLEEEDG